MKPFFPSFWNVLHDGGIERIEGTVPGDVRLHISIEYLRERFADTGDTIVVTLHNCNQFSHRLYDSSIAVTNLSQIAGESATILSAEMQGTVCRVFTDLGVLETVCGAGSISLDSERKISLQELLSVAESYWDEWESKSKRP
jgi:hypothetical protein